MWLWDVRWELESLLLGESLLQVNHNHSCSVCAPTRSDLWFSKFGSYMFGQGPKKVISRLSST